MVSDSSGFSLDETEGKSEGATRGRLGYIN